MEDDTIKVAGVTMDIIAEAAATAKGQNPDTTQAGAEVVKTPSGDQTMGVIIILGTGQSHESSTYPTQQKGTQKMVIYL